MTTPNRYEHYSPIREPWLNGDSTEIQYITTDSDQPAQGPDIETPNGLWIKARSTNSGLAFFGFSSDVDSDDFELTAGEYAPPVNATNMSKLWFYTDTVGDKLIILKA